LMGPLAPADRTVAHAWPSSLREPEENRRLLDEVAWAYETPHLRALGFEFTVRASSEPVGRYLHGILRAFEDQGERGHVYSFIDPEQAPNHRYELYRDGEPVSSTVFPSTALRHLLWDVNGQVVQETPHLLLFHASAVEHGGRAILFPAPMGSGKTTLVAGLLLRGRRYVTDETVAIDPATSTVWPYPKPLGIDPGSWDILQSLRPDVHPSLVPFLEQGWHVPPGAIGRGVVAPACEPGFVIAPRYERGASTELVEIRRSEAMIVLAENAFNITTFGTQGSMEAMAGIVRGSRCYRLTVGDLADACEKVLELLEAPSVGTDR
jgi:hypothetical protein